MLTTGPFLLMLCSGPTARQCGKEAIDPERTQVRMQPLAHAQKDDCD